MGDVEIDRRAELIAIFERSWEESEQSGRLDKAEARARYERFEAAVYEFYENQIEGPLTPRKVAHLAGELIADLALSSTAPLESQLQKQLMGGNATRACKTFISVVTDTATMANAKRTQRTALLIAAGVLGLMALGCCGGLAVVTGALGGG